MAQQKDAKLDVWVYKGWHSKVPQLHGLNGRNLFSHSSAGQKFVIQVSARVASPETSFYLLWMTVFSPYLYIVFLLYIYFCVYTSLVALVVKKKNLPANAGDIGNMGSIPGLGRSPGGGHGHPLQYSCLENPMDPHPMEELGGLQSIGSHRVGHN